MESLLQHLQAIQPLSSALEEYLINRVKTKYVNKGSYLLNAESISRHIYFIERGLFRCFYEVGDKTISSWFMKEGDVILSVRSFFEQLPSHECIQALENSTVHYIGYQELMEAYKDFPEFNFHGRFLTERYYIKSESRIYALRAKSAYDRYLHLLKWEPELLLRVPAKYLATYLGMAEFTLSRIRASAK